MERPTPPARLRMSLLAERYYEEAPRCPVVCRLWRMRPDLPVEGTAVYALGMESPSGRYLYCVGEDEVAARGGFGRITAGRLSPHHLGGRGGGFPVGAEPSGERNGGISRKAFTNQSKYGIMG